MTTLRTALVVGALAGFVASHTMDAVTRAFYARQDDASKQREEELAHGGTLLQLGKQLGTLFGRDLDDEAARRVGTALHRTLGTTYGAVAADLVRRGAPPVATGLAVGAAAFLVVDEGTSLPLATSYPLVSHLRGVVGHATVGLTIGVLLRFAGLTPDAVPCPSAGLSRRQPGPHRHARLRTRCHSVLASP